MTAAHRAGRARHDESVFGLGAETGDPNTWYSISEQMQPNPRPRWLSGPPQFVVVVIACVAGACALLRVLAEVMR